MNCTIIIVLLIFSSFFCSVVMIEKGIIPDPNLGWSHEYVMGHGNIQGNVNVDYFRKIDSSLEIGANRYGVAVFKNPISAMNYLKSNYVLGIKAIQKEYSLGSLSNFNYQQYSNFGWQLRNATIEEKKQGRFISSFMDIYENSFK